MLRLYTKNSTGVAPDGRWYAGDINALQDAVAGVSDFSQTLDAATFRVGDPSIQLLKYGTAEARLSAALRVDGILRGLGGMSPGAFTTAQRDAMPAGTRPYGLIILNTTVNHLEINLGTDTVPAWSAIGVTPGAVTEPVLASKSVSDRAMGDNVISKVGTLAQRPLASAVSAGVEYFATDSKTLYRSDGNSVWMPISQTAQAFVGASITELNNAFNNSPPDGAIGILRPAGTDQRMMVMYDGQAGKWVSETKLWSSGSGQGSSGSTGDFLFYVQQRTALGFNYEYGPLIPWKIWSDAGLSLKLRYMCQGQNANGGWYVQPMFSGILPNVNANASPGTSNGTRITGTTTAGPSLLLGDTAEGSWRSTLGTVVDYALPYFQVSTQISPANTTSNIYTFQMFYRYTT